MIGWQERGNKLLSKLTVIAGLVFLFVFVVKVHAIATGYATSDSGIQTGMAVSLSDNGSGEPSVERASQQDSDKIVGIVTTIDASLISVGSGNSTVLVENQGQVEAYVSDINGVVEAGDLLALSPLKGVLMRQENTALVAVGVAVSGPEQTSTYGYDDSGSTKETQIAKITMNLDYKGGQGGSSQSNSALAKLGRSLVGKEVSETRVLIALIMFVMVLIVEGAIIYGAVSSAVNALGRNPMAKTIIRGELLRVSVVAVLVLLVGLGAVYLVLWI